MRRATPTGFGIDNAGRLTVSIPCAHCGYDLRALALDGRCPECGRPVTDSLRTDDLRLSSTEQLIRVRHVAAAAVRGLFMLAVLPACILMVLAGTVLFLMSAPRGLASALATVPRRVFGLLFLVLGAISFMGAALLVLLLVRLARTKDQPLLNDCRTRLRRRTTLAAVGVAVLLGMGASLGGSRGYWAAVVAAGLGLLALLGVITPLCSVIQTLWNALSRPDQARRVRYQQAAMQASATLLLVAGSTGLAWAWYRSAWPNRDILPTTLNLATVLAAINACLAIVVLAVHAYRLRRRLDQMLIKREQPDA